MSKITKFLTILVCLAVLLASSYFFLVLPKKIDSKMNAVTPHAAYEISEAGKTLHSQLRVADLHADTLLWKRDPAKTHNFGQTDFPRLRQGGVALQVFSTVTFVPGGQNVKSNAATKDRILPLVIANNWPIRSWGSIYERAAHQAHRLQDLEIKSDGKFVIARTGAELIETLKAREVDPEILVGILATEGAHPLEGELSNIDRLYDEGFRLIGLQHFFDNELGGSLHGLSNDGLTEFGRAAVNQMVAKGLLIDVAHSSVKTVEDVLALTTSPILISHTGILSKCNHPDRNIPDRLMRQIAERGGVIGIGYWEMAVCDTSPEGIADMLIYGANTFGVDHIVLGSDFDGSIEAEFDTSELDVLTDALLRKGMSEADIAKVMGENLIEYFARNLPK
jgi:microsomal dipeptidase-like Zn-dependent dipeptidase